MAYILCDQHGGNAAIFASPKIVEVMQRKERKLQRRMITNFEFSIGENLPIFDLLNHIPNGQVSKYLLIND